MPSQIFSRSSVQKFAIFTVAVLVASSCGTDDTTSTSDVATNSPQTSEATADANQPETTDATAETLTIDRSEWPGEELEADGLTAAEGDVLSVIGVKFDDVLNVRSGPGTGFDIIDSLEPTSNAVATGEAWQNNGYWYEVTAGTETGWTAESFFAYLGPADDATSEITQSGGVFQAETMAELGELVAATQTSKDTQSTVTQISNPIVGELGEVMFDVVGLGEPAVIGFRLHIVGQENETGDLFELKSVERTTLCGRGITDGVCS